MVEEKNKQKLVCCIMGQDCERFIGMALESVKDSDAIVYCDGGSTDSTFDEWDDFVAPIDDGRFEIIRNTYDKEDRTMNGKQRNFYLNYLKEYYPDHWALIIDSDELVADLETIKDFIQTAKKGLYSVKMRHFIDNLGQEDATVETHWALNRLFKISEAGVYPEVEHPVLSGITVGMYQGTTIWHLGYISGVFDIKNKFENHSKKSNMHSQEFLNNWYNEHLFGNYPVKKLNPIDIPPIILKNFGINPDELYFNNHCQLELRHFLMLKQWVEHFKPKKILDLGAGMGLYGYVADYLGIDYLGIEQSEFAVSRAVSNIIQGDIRKSLAMKSFIQRDLVLVLDLLEHLKESEIDMTLNLIKDYGTNFIFSIPYEGDANLHLDPTHRIFKPKKWWINKLSKYFKISGVPENWHFSPQLLIGEAK